MRKIVSVLIVVFLIVAFFTSCSDPVRRDFEEYLEHMGDIEENHEKIKDEMGKWQDFKVDAELSKNIYVEVLPLVENSLVKLEEMTPKTEKVTKLKDDYYNVMLTYKAAFIYFMEGIDYAESTRVDEGIAKIYEAAKLDSEYRESLQELSETLNIEIEKYLK